MDWFGRKGMSCGVDAGVTVRSWNEAERSTVQADVAGVDIHGYGGRAEEFLWQLADGIVRVELLVASGVGSAEVPSSTMKDVVHARIHFTELAEESRDAGSTSKVSPRGVP